MRRVKATMRTASLNAHCQTGTRLSSISKQAHDTGQRHPDRSSRPKLSKNAAHHGDDALPLAGALGAVLAIACIVGGQLGS